MRYKSSEVVFERFLICNLSKSHKLRTTCQCVGGGIRQLCIRVLRQAVQTCTDVCMVERKGAGDRGTIEPCVFKYVRDRVLTITQMNTP